MTMLLEDAQRFTAHCFNGEPASCTYACPYHLDLRSLLKKAGKGRWDSYYKEMATAVSFPLVAGSLCDRACETHCQRRLVGDEPVQIREVEAAAIAYAKNQVPDVFSSVPKPDPVAVIGAGPAGLSAAFQIARKGYPVTVYEAADTIGGSLKGREEFPRFWEEIQAKFSVTQVEFRLSETVTSLDDLPEWKALILATGKDGNTFGLADSRDDVSFQTARAGVFAIGEVCGTDTCHALAEGNRIANCVEAYLLSGGTEFAHVQWDRELCNRYVDHPGAVSKPAVVKTGELFTKDEAKAEASRCMECDCDKCFTECDMLRKYKKKPHKLATEVYMDSTARPRISATVATRTAYSCTMCGRCRSKCPEKVDLGGLLQLSRANRLERDYYPPALHDYWLREMDFAVSEAGFAAPPPGQDACQYAFFPGCQLGAANPEYVFRSYDFLTENYDTGIILGCCGAPAYWGGDNRRVTENQDRIRGQWESMGKPTLVFACATCERQFEKFMPEIPRVSLYTLLAGSGKVAPKAVFPQASIFDPCSAEASDGIKAAVRSLVEKAGTAVSDYDSDGFCCGNGGHIMLANPDLYNDLANKQAYESDLPYVVYCVNCREVFAQREKPCVHVLDMVFDLEPCGNITLEEKRVNSLKVKKTILKKWGQDFTPQHRPWDDVNIQIPGPVQEAMEKKLITDSDVRETIWSAEQSGEGFTDEDGNVACWMVKPALTYWVQYQKDGDLYRVSDVYCHRMHFRNN